MGSFVTAQWIRAMRSAAESLSLELRTSEVLLLERTAILPRFLSARLRCAGDFVREVTGRGCEGSVSLLVRHPGANRVLSHIGWPAARHGASRRSCGGGRFRAGGRYGCTRYRS